MQACRIHGPPTFPGDSVGRGQGDLHVPRILAQVGLEKVDSRTAGQEIGNDTQPDGDCAENTRLAARVAAMQNGQRRIERQTKVLDCPIVLDLHGLELHERRSRVRGRGSVSNIRSAVSTRRGRRRCIAMPSQ